MNYQFKPNGSIYDTQNKVSLLSYSPEQLDQQLTKSIGKDLSAIQKEADIKVIPENELMTSDELKRKYATTLPDREQPKFPGGMAGLMNYISEHIKYPTIAQEWGIEGKVIVMYIVTRDGEVKNIRITQSKDPHLDKEAVRIISNLPKWEPAILNGQFIDSEYVTPVVFRLR